MNETSFNKAADCLQQIAAKLTKEKDIVIIGIYLSYGNNSYEGMCLNGSIVYAGNEFISALCSGIESEGLVPKISSIRVDGSPQGEDMGTRLFIKFTLKG